LLLTQFASQGYIVIGADYFGLGESELATLISNEPARNQLALAISYSAARQFLEEQTRARSGSVLHTGLVAGVATTTLIFLRRLEQAGIPVTASATASAPSRLGVLHRSRGM
jgi:hypothetical protein